MRKQEKLVGAPIKSCLNFLSGLWSISIDWRKSRTLVSMKGTSRKKTNLRTKMENNKLERVRRGQEDIKEKNRRRAMKRSLQSCPTLCDPHRWQPTRLPRPWDSPGKNTGVGCHFLLQCMKVKSQSEVVFNSQQPHGLQHTRLLRPWDFPGKSTGVGCHCHEEVVSGKR